MNKNILLIPILLFLCTGTAFSFFGSFFNKSQMVENIIQDLEEEMFCEYLLELFIENKEKSDKEIIDLFIASSNEKNIDEVSKALRTKRAALQNDIFYLKVRKIVDYKSFINMGLAAISTSAALFAKYTYHAPFYGYLRSRASAKRGYAYYYFDELYMYNKSDLDQVNNNINLRQSWLDVHNSTKYTPNDLDDDKSLTPSDYKELFELLIVEHDKTSKRDKKYIQKYQKKAAKIQQSLKEQADYIKKPIIISIVSFLAIPLISLKNYKKINAEITEKNNEITQINAILRLCRKYKSALSK